MPLQDVTSTPLPRLAPRAADSHKGDFGRALLIGGSRGMSGAIAMSGLAALRSGAGLVTLAVPQSIHNVAAGFCPCYMTRALVDDGMRLVGDSANELTALAKDMTALAVGPGLGRSAAVTDVVCQLYS